MQPWWWKRLDREMSNVCLGRSHNKCGARVNTQFCPQIENYCYGGTESGVSVPEDPLGRAVAMRRDDETAQSELSNNCGIERNSEWKRERKMMRKNKKKKRREKKPLRVVNVSGGRGAVR